MRRCRPTSRMPTTMDDARRRYQTVFARACPARWPADRGAAFRRGRAGGSRAGVRHGNVTLHVAPAPSSRCRVRTIADHRMRSRGSRCREYRRRHRRTHARGRRSSRSARPRCVRSGRAGHARPAAARRRAGHRHLHHAGLRLPRGRPAGDQLPPAAQHADDAGQRLRQASTRSARSTPTRSRDGCASSATATRCCSSVQHLPATTAIHPATALCHADKAAASLDLAQPWGAGAPLP